MVIFCLYILIYFNVLMEMSSRSCTLKTVQENHSLLCRCECFGFKTMGFRLKFMQCVGAEELRMKLEEFRDEDLPENEFFDFQIFEVCVYLAFDLFFEQIKLLPPHGTVDFYV